jgi:hypothetical protein
MGRRRSCKYDSYLLKLGLVSPSPTWEYTLRSGRESCLMDGAPELHLPMTSAICGETEFPHIRICAVFDKRLP